MTRVVHGGATAAELAAGAAAGVPIVDLSASLNPYGPHPRVVAAAQAADVARYPEADAATLRAAYAQVAGVDPAQVVAGNGSSELVYLAALAAARAGLSRAVVLGPTFGEYARAAAAAEMAVEVAAVFDPTSGSLDLDEARRVVAGGGPALVFVCNPNNPTGTLLTRREVGELTVAALGRGGQLLVDEAYMPFATPPAWSTPAVGRLVLRSLTKLHAIPGLRVGFILAAPDEAAAIAGHQPPWSVSAPAAAAALQALAETDFAAASVARLAATREQLRTRLKEAGFLAAPAAANFLLVHVGDAPAFRERLLGHGFVARDGTSFGLPGHVRLAIPHADHADRLAAAMEASR